MHHSGYIGLILSFAEGFVDTNRWKENKLDVVSERFINSQLITNFWINLSKFLDNI